MKKLCALAASLILGAASLGAQAGDRHHRDYDDHHHHYERHHDDWHGGYRHVSYREYRPVVYYRPAPVYYRPVQYYYPETVYRERVRYRDDGDIHGSISIGF